MNCGRKRVWMDPNETMDISNANSRQSIRRLISNGLILKKAITVRSRYRIRERLAAKQRGRHRGYGKRKGTANARLPQKKVWIKRLRVLRSLLKYYREEKKIDCHFYRELYLKSKGNVFKNKRVLIDFIHKKKLEDQRLKTLKDQLEAKKANSKALKVGEVSSSLKSKVSV